MLPGSGTGAGGGNGGGGGGGGDVVEQGGFAQLLGLGGGAIPGPPPPNGGPKNPEPGPSPSPGGVRRSNADSMLLGKSMCVAEPPTPNGSSSCSGSGSSVETAVCGRTETWLAQRVRAEMLPSVIKRSPCLNLICLRVQKILSPSR